MLFIKSFFSLLALAFPVTTQLHQPQCGPPSLIDLSPHIQDCLRLFSRIHDDPHIDEVFVWSHRRPPISRTRWRRLTSVWEEGYCVLELEPVNIHPVRYDMFSMRSLLPAMYLLLDKCLLPQHGAGGMIRVGPRAVTQMELFIEGYGNSNSSRHVVEQ